MQYSENNDLDAGKTPSEITAPVSHNAVQLKTNVVKTPIGDDDAVLFGDEKLMSYSDGLDLLRPEKSQTVRFALLTQFLAPRRAFNHYIEKKGTFRCLSTADQEAFCCQKLKKSQPQIVALALHYTNPNPKSGKYAKDANGNLPPIEWQIKYVRLSKAGYQKISRLIPEEQEPGDIDILMSHCNSGIGYDYSALPSALWKRNPQLVQEVAAAVQPFLKDGGKLLASKLGKKLTVVEFKLALTGVATPENADVSGIEEM